MDIGAGAYPPLSGITDDNHAGVIIVFVVASVLFSICFALIRFLLSARKRLGFWYDDLFISLCLTFTIIHAVLVAQATHYGLGKHMSSLDEHDITRFFKITYVNRIIAVFSLSFAKYSLALLYRRLDIYQSTKMHIALLSTITIFMLFGIFAIAFQCGIPSPWELTAPQCTSGLGISIAVAAANFITDLILVIYPFYGIVQLTMTPSLKMTVLALFSSRLLACVMVVFEIVYFAHAFRKSDITWELVTPTVMGVVLVMISFITSTAPRIHSFLATIATGRMTVQLPTMIIGRRTQSDNPSHNNTLPTRTLRNTYPRTSSEQPEPLILVPQYDNIITTEITSEHHSKRS